MEKADTRLPRAVVFCDSYIGALAPFLSEHLSRVVYLPEDAPGFDADVVERERPDVVIHEMTERKLFLDELPPDSVEVGAQ